MMNLFDELKARGFCYQCTDEAAIRKLLDHGNVRFYVGFDPTGNSLHVGHLLPVMAMRLMQKAGHVPIVLVGGATARIGDPSGKQSARPILTVEEVDQNAECLRRQLAHFISDEEGKAFFVNNADWLCKIGYIDMLREVGHIFSVNRMLGQDSVKQRLENGLSFLEFNYSILQAYDFLHLNRTLDCKMQFGGQDQWGNMVAGTELVRRKSGNEVECMTIPLLLDANGQKFGKTAGGNNVWLSTERTSVFDYYQFWRNSEDAQVEQLLLYFSSLPVEEVIRLADPSGNINRAKEILAFEATMLAHGREAAAEAYVTAGTKFGFADRDNKVYTSSLIAQVASDSIEIELPTYELNPAELDDTAGLTVSKLLALSGLCKSSSDGRRLIQGNAVAINDVKVTDPSAKVTKELFADGALVLKAGKKSFRKILLG